MCLGSELDAIELAVGAIFVIRNGQLVSYQLPRSFALKLSARKFTAMPPLKVAIFAKQKIVIPLRLRIELIPISNEQLAAHRGRRLFGRRYRRCQRGLWSVGWDLGWNGCVCWWDTRCRGRRWNSGRGGENWRWSRRLTANEQERENDSERKKFFHDTPSCCVSFYFTRICVSAPDQFLLISCPKKNAVLRQHFPERLALAEVCGRVDSPPKQKEPKPEKCSKILWLPSRIISYNVTQQLPTETFLTRQVLMYGYCPIRTSGDLFRQ